MKKIKSILLLCFIAMSTAIIAQTASASDYYLGKWDITILGTPQGDAKMVLSLNRKDGKLAGEVLNPTDSTSVTLSNVEEVDGKVTIYFSMMGYDLNIPFEKTDDDNMKGLLMGMFETKGKRVK
jgi:FlaG/FlaF family flagellin (archaellin)